MMGTNQISNECLSNQVIETNQPIPVRSLWDRLKKKTVTEASEND